MDDATDDTDDEPATITPEHDTLLLDVMLGKLATYLRVCGYDAVDALDEGIERDDEIRERAATDGRRLITRDRDLAAATPGSVLLTRRDVVAQLRELRAAGVELTPTDRLTRCGTCNGRLEPTEDDTDRPEYAPETGFVWRFVDCEQYFW
ncbi:Mut7-C RNAse domain-containing protein [Halobaculum rubrum]|uniref:Mut7-C RNAse domain-containing protein n=1 Tax=Halobaculum rubrum TaxID=2872158 RepID=UPI001CA4161A|nr:Mut7-C RNAse domain-containing protein [Halobaculum rubrum]QZY00555.1 Mut7-C RNAse domain-containing protein [Halobaculum rubrum]